MYAHNFWNMSLKNIDMMSAMRTLAERRIEEAMREGKFYNLAGKGQPINLEDMPAEESARMTWRILRILKNNDFVPDEVRMRKSLDLLRERMETVTDEMALRVIVEQINQLVYNVNTLGTNALSAPVVTVDLADALAAMRARVR